MRHARITSIDLARILVPILLILLILTYASLPFLPHSHTCIGEECALCAMLKSGFEIALCLFTVFLIRVTPDLLIGVAHGQRQTTEIKSDTPIDLRVKLSD